MLKHSMFKHFNTIRPYRIYASEEESEFDSDIKIKKDSPPEVKKAYEKILAWQKRTEEKRKRGVKF